MKKSLYRLSALALAFMMASTGCFVTSYADTGNDKEQSGVTPRDIINHFETTVTSRDYTTDHTGTRKLIATHTATKAGETYTAGISVDYSNTVNISLSAAATKSLSLAIGFDIGSKPSLSGSATTPALKKGETVKVYATPNYSLSKATVKEVQLNTETGDKKVISTKEVIAKKAILPYISFEYSGGTSRSVTRTETYAPNEYGVYVLVQD